MLKVKFCSDALYCQVLLAAFLENEEKSSYFLLKKLFWVGYIIPILDQDCSLAEVDFKERLIQLIALYPQFQLLYDFLVWLVLVKQDLSSIAASETKAKILASPYLHLDPAYLYLLHKMENALILDSNPKSCANVEL